MTRQVACLHIELDQIEPRIWRRVEVSGATNLRALHELIQAVMPWENAHLYRFTIAGRVYGEPGPEDALWGHNIFQAKSMRLVTLIDRGISEFIYTYDLGDDWRHRVTVEALEEADPDADYPRFLGGERRAPPEDVGGPDGFLDFVEAMANRGHPRHRELARWHGGPFNATDIGKAQIMSRVREIAKRRKVALDAFERSRVPGGS